MVINRTHLILMTILSKHNATSAGTAISTAEIKQFCAIGKSNTTLHRAFCFLRLNHYIKQGVKDGKFFTYLFNVLRRSRGWDRNHYYSIFHYYLLVFMYIIYVYGVLYK